MVSGTGKNGYGKNYMAQVMAQVMELRGQVNE
jgi:hypothetical protein